jgi:hypothetical protein
MGLACCTDKPAPVLASNSATASNAFRTMASILAMIICLY